MTLLTQYLKEEKINGLSEATLYNLKSFFSMVNEYKPLDTWSRDDINNFILKSQSEYKSSTVELQKRRLKKFFIWAGKPDIVKRMNLKHYLSPIDSRRTNL